MKSTKLTFPWGTEDLFIHNTPATVKLLYVNKGEMPSLQYHHKRDEFWKIISGHPNIIIGDTHVTGAPGDEFSVPQMTQHRISAVDDDVVILEIATGDFDEADIVRLEDKYHRV